MSQEKSKHLSIHSFTNSLKQENESIDDNFKIGDFSSKYFSRKSSTFTNHSITDDLPQNSPNLKRVEGGFEDKTSVNELSVPNSVDRRGSESFKPSSLSIAQQSLTTSLISNGTKQLPSSRRASMNLTANGIHVPVPLGPSLVPGSVSTLNPSPKQFGDFRLSNNTSPLRPNPTTINIDTINPLPNTVEIVGRHLVNESDIISISSSNKGRPNIIDGTDNFDSLKLQGGDISREVYNWQRDHTINKDSIRRRSQSFSGSLADSMTSPDFQVQDIRVPGGFRRSFLIQKRSRQGLVEHKPTFFTRNFIEFLTLYGHFAGEELRDEEDVDEDEYEETYEHDEESLLLSSVRPKPHNEHKTSTTKAVLLLLKAFLGTGVLFLPRGFRNAGYVFAITALVFFSVLSYYCFISLINVRIKIGSGSYGDIAFKLFGNKLRKAILTSIVLSQIGFAAAYIVFTGKNLQAFVISILGKNLDIEFYIILQLFVFIPLSLTRKIAKLSGTALIADLFIFLGLFYVFYHCSFVVATQGIADIVEFSSDWTVFIGTAIFTYEGIGLLIPIQESMEEPSKFPFLLFAVMLTATVSFVVIGTIGYFAFGSETETVILLNFPKDSIIVSLIQFLYVTAILLSTPLQLFPAIRILENGLIKKSGKYDSSIKWQKNYFRIALVIVTACISWGGASDLDKFVAIVGSFACIPLIYIFPPLLHLKAMTSSIWIKSLDVAIIILGFWLMTYTSWQTISEWIH